MSLSSCLPSAFLCYFLFSIFAVTPTSAQAVSCENQDGSLFNYDHFHNCLLSNVQSLSLVILFCWLIVLIYLLSSTAETYFAPAIQTLTSAFQIPPNIAGVTLLAFGNGAPDMVSSVVAFGNGVGSIGLASVVGGGLFISTVVIGAICYSVQDGVTVNRRPLLRDGVFYVVAMSYVFGLFISGKVFLAQAIIFVGLYVFYVCTVVAGRIWYQKRQRSQGVLSPTATAPAGRERDTSMFDTSDTYDYGLLFNKALRRLPYHLFEAIPGAQVQRTASFSRIEMIPPPTTQVISRSTSDSSIRLSSQFLPKVETDKTNAMAFIAHMKGWARRWRDVAHRHAMQPAGSPRTDELESKEAESGLARFKRDSLAPNAIKSQREQNRRWTQDVREKPRVVLQEELQTAQQQLNTHPFFAIAQAKKAARAWLKETRRRHSSRDEDDMIRLPDIIVTPAEPIEPIPESVNSEAPSRKTSTNSEAGSVLAQPFSSIVIPRPDLRPDSATLSPRPRLSATGTVLFDRSVPAARPSDVPSMLSSRSRTSANSLANLYQAISSTPQVKAVGSAVVWFYRTLRVLFEVIKFIPDVLRKVTIPRVDVEAWDKRLITGNVALSLGFAAFALGYYDSSYDVGVMPITPLLICVGVGIALILWPFIPVTIPKTRPQLAVLSILSVLLSMCWIYVVANELVSLLTALGRFVGFSVTLLGCTALAWGNASGDLAADVAIAKSGLPSMALAGALSGPMMNILLGVGVGLVVATFKSYPEPWLLEQSSTYYVLFVAVILSTIHHLIVIPRQDFKLTKKYGWYLWAYYAVVFMLIVLCETSII
eukprot:GILJ01005537.1.p1 GENE.GILJ01005537.1~~GILJ01005537.1.p1  ORF type:complete len:820 (-),score=121.14 GILJ01005537.1:940-3399(-)